MWHVSFYSGEAGCKLQYSIYFTFTLQCFDAFAFSVLTCVRACVHALLYSAIDCNIYLVSDAVTSVRCWQG